MKKLSVGLPFRGQGKVQTKSWLLLLALGLLACMTMCLILVWSNIERIDTTYFINIAQNKLQERKALRAKLEVERERLLSPYELRRKAEEIGELFRTQFGMRRVMLFLSSDLSDYVSGQVIGVDGCEIM